MLAMDLEGKLTMNRALTELLEALRVDRLEENLFRGPSHDLGFGRVFGGTLLAQSLAAAAQTVPSERQVHSLHAYFLNKGDVRQSVSYQVERLRDGGNASVRRVMASQEGRPTFVLMASFQADIEGLEYADAMPSTVSPEDVAPDAEAWRRYSHLLPETLRARVMNEQPLDFRTIDPTDPFVPKKQSPDQSIWFRTTDPLPSDPLIHRCLLAYCSDFGLLGAALRPHGYSDYDPRLRLASIDHAVWFHRPFRADEWLLHVMHSCSSASGRCVVRGNVFSRDGRLVASTAQEGLLRDLTKARGTEP